MANHSSATRPGASGWRLTEALNAKLSDLIERGLQVQWIEASLEDLTLLMREGGDGAIRMDPEPGVDRAWFGAVEIRHNGAQANTWIFVKGEVAAGAVSAHVVQPPPT